jgi:hypothetical protein
MHSHVHVQVHLVKAELNERLVLTSLRKALSTPGPNVDSLDAAISDAEVR